MKNSQEKPEKPKYRDRIIGKSSDIKETKMIARRIAPKLVAVSLIGLSGSGKTAIAKLIHACSDRKDLPFITINCGAIPETLFESTIFGYVKSAFTGADKDKKGLIEFANKGTLFFDDIDSLSLNNQASLLRVLEEKSFIPVGGDKEIHADFRLITATNKNLYELVAKNKFRNDLFFRINSIPIYIPSLIDRRDDIIILAKHFIEFYYKKEGLQKWPCLSLSKEAEELLNKYHWPGNIRELKHICKRIVYLFDGDEPIISEDFVKKQMVGELSRGNINENNFISELWNYIVLQNLEAKKKHDSKEKQKDESKGKSKGKSRGKSKGKLRDLENKLIGYGLGIQKKSRREIAEILGIDVANISRKIKDNSLQ